MNDSKSQTQAGLFVAIGGTIFLLSILIFGGDRAFLKSYETYTLRFPSTQGLDKGSSVSLSGFPVGNVTQISFEPSGRLITKIRVESKFSHLINDQVLADVRTQGALGDKYIYITPGPSSGQLIPSGGEVPTDSKPDFMDMISGKGSDISAFTGAIRELNQLLHNFNTDNRSARLVENFIDASKNVSKLLGEPSVRQSFVHLRNVLQKLDNGDGTLGQLINNPALFERIMALLGDSPRNQYLKPLLREAIKQNDAQR